MAGIHLEVNAFFAAGLPSWDVTVLRWRFDLPDTFTQPLLSCSSRL